MAVVKTYLGAVKPVGEKILLNFAPTVRSVSVDAAVEFDFLINQNYYVTGLSVTKTNAALPAAVAGVALAATVMLVNNLNVVPADGYIAQAGFSSIDVGVGGLVGTKAIAGLPAGTTAVGAIPVTVVYPATTNAGGRGTGGVASLAVPATVPTALTGNAQQRIRLKIQWAGSVANNLDPSCFVEIKLAKYNDLVTQGTSAGLNGIQDSELLNPPV